MKPSYSIEGNSLTIHDFKTRFDYWTSQEWREQITTLILDDGVVEVPDGAFQYFKNLEEVHLPPSLKRIGDSAFAQCEALTEIYLPDGLESLGNYVFQDTPGLRELRIPASLRVLGEQALYIGSGSHGWGIIYKEKLIGTIGAYDYDADKSWIEIGMSIERASWGQGFATEAVTVVLCYLTEHENIKTVSAWCASDNIGSRKAIEKAGMKMVRSDKGALEINGQTYDKLVFEYAQQ